MIPSQLRRQIFFYKFNETEPFGGQNRRKYKQTLTAMFYNDKPETINNCNIYSEIDMCKLGVLKTVLVTLKDGVYYLYEDGRCLVLTTASDKQVKTLTEASEISDNEDVLSPAVKYSDRCINK